MSERYEAWFSKYNDPFYKILFTLIAFLIAPYYVQLSIF